MILVPLVQHVDFPSYLPLELFARPKTSAQQLIDLPKQRKLTFLHFLPWRHWRFYCCCILWRVIFLLLLIWLFAGGVPILSCPFLYLTSNCCSPICWRAKKKEKKRKWRLVWSYLPGWTTSTHSFHRGRELNSEYNRVWQFVSVLTLGRQNREVLNVFVSSDGGTSNSRRARERESLRHIWVALIIQVKLYLTFFFLKKKKNSVWRGQHLCVLMCPVFLSSSKKRDGGFKKTKTWTKDLLSHLVASLNYSFCIF